MRALGLTPAILATALACDSPTALLLGIDAAVTPAAIVPGEVATIRVTITNHGFRPVEVSLHCQHVFRITTQAGQVVVGDEPLFCALILVPPTRLGPGKSITRAWLGYAYRSAGGSLVANPVPAGRYLVYGTLGSLISRPDTLEVLAP